MFNHTDLTHQLVRDRHDQVRREFVREPGATRLRRRRVREHERHLRLVHPVHRAPRTP